MILAIKPFEIHDGDGIRTTIFFKGCPLRCIWCHNPESQSFGKELFFDESRCAHCLRCASVCDANRADGGKHIFERQNCTVCGRCEHVCPHSAFEVMGDDASADTIADEVLKDALFFADSGGGVTLSGGEPLMQPRLAAAVARRVKERGISLAVDSCAFVPWDNIRTIAPYTDQFLFDIKAIDERVHIACTGQSSRLILDNIRRADALGIPTEIRYPFVPGCNDGEAEAIGRFVSTLKSVSCLRVLPYHSFAEDKYTCLGRAYPAKDVPLPTAEALSAARETIRKCGVTVSDEA